nr:hypothetical protein [Nocardia cyriacigeorgica]
MAEDAGRRATVGLTGVDEERVTQVDVTCGAGGIGDLAMDGGGIGAGGEGAGVETFLACGCEDLCDVVV